LGQCADIIALSCYVCVRCVAQCGRHKQLKLTDSQFENAKIKVQNAKLWSPDVVGVTIFI